MHEIWMQKTLDLAARGQYSAQPNPMVGCLIVKNNQIIGEGFHLKPGAPHAEIHALNLAGEHAVGADVYVNLEPCCHFGRTPPCVDALIKAQVKRVYIATLDPNPRVQGGGVQKLQAANIEVKVGVLQTQAQQLNRIFFHYINTQTPYVIGKWAMSLDGKLSVAEADNKTLSSPESLVDLHRLRQRSAAILIGAETARQDNPSLTVRFSEPAALIHHPQRIVLNTAADLPLHLKLFNGHLPGQTWLICAPEAAKSAMQKFPAHSTRVLPCTTCADKIDLPALLALLGQLEIASLLVEGGAQILKNFFIQNLVNEVTAYCTPWIISDLPHKIKLHTVSLANFGQDCKITGQI